MVFEAARLAFINLFASETRGVFWKVLGLTLAALLVVWILIRKIFIWLALPWLEQLVPGIPEWAGWIGFVLGIVASIGLALALALLISPVTAAIAGLFLDDVAEVVEQRDYPQDQPGVAMPLGQSIISALSFFGIVVLGNLIALLMLLIPGINLIAFFLVNGYLLGREFFEFAAMRYRSIHDAKAFRRQNRGTVLMGGFVIAGFLAIPLLNLLTPLFAAGLMVHLYKMLNREQQIV
ncbi:sulfate transporter family protein [Rhizobium sp. L1K21]|uniref:sulfate transporter family protein n=1 Tax=Rhizobium sp. L1K21 TaxID=2954933 RepID=UPI002093FD65|nr:sulfate transporter family protein [Rhizobium sp. L1K21]MCO6187240.1 sulfate transporter family protein [Rhizobium sp. L1K21]